MSYVLEHKLCLMVFKILHYYKKKSILRSQAAQCGVRDGLEVFSEYLGIRLSVSFHLYCIHSFIHLSHRHYIILKIYSIVKNCI